MPSRYQKQDISSLSTPNEKIYQESTSWKVALNIAKELWLSRATGDTIDEPCPLCKIAEKVNGSGITDMEGDNRCQGCPIDELTGKGCHGTPYIIWIKTERLKDPAAMDLARDASEREAAMIEALQKGDKAIARTFLI